MNSDFEELKLINYLKDGVEGQNLNMDLFNIHHFIITNVKLFQYLSMFCYIS